MNTSTAVSFKKSRKKKVFDLPEIKKYILFNTVRGYFNISDLRVELGVLRGFKKFK